MNNKIIGFTVSKRIIDHTDINVFNKRLSLNYFRYGGLNIYLWGIGNLAKCKIKKNVYSLSFPSTSTLKDRNVLITLKDDYVVIENDWLGSIPIFYNKKEVVVSTLMNKTYKKEKISIDAEGLNNYLEFGYSVFGKTPIEKVKFLRYYSKITITSSKISIFEKKDIVIKHLVEHEVMPTDVLEKIRNYIRDREDEVSGDLIIPTSGGFDSRLLNVMISNKKRIRSFTYGISNQQSASSEVIKAKTLSKILKTRWKQIELGSFNKYLKEWFKIFDCAIHLQGMYHIEFYDEIFKGSSKIYGTLLSGIVGDVWSGKVNLKSIKSAKDLVELSYSHGINVDPCISKLTEKGILKREFYKNNRKYLKNSRYKIITTIRIKIILLSYLLSIPDYFSYPSWTPFLNMPVALSILKLSDFEREDRKWERDFFSKNGVDLENINLKYSDSNTLDAQASKKIPVENISKTVLKPFIREKELDKLYKNYEAFMKNGLLKQTLVQNNRIGNLLSFLRINTDQMKAYNQIAILKCIEMALTQK